MEDRNTAIHRFQESAEAVPAGPPRAERWHEAGEYFRERYNTTGFDPDLDEAVSFFRMAIAERPNHPPSLLAHRGCLVQHYKKTNGSLESIDEVVAAFRLEIGAASDEHPTDCHTVNGLLHFLQARMRKRGELTDMLEVLRLREKNTPTEDPFPEVISMFLCGPDALERNPRLSPSIQSLTNMTRSMSPDDANLGRVLRLLGSLLHVRHKASRSDLSNAIEYLDRAVPVTPAEGCRHSSLLTDLSLALVERADAEHKDLRRAFEITSRAGSVTPVLDKEIGRCWLLLGKRCIECYTTNNSMEYIDTAVDSLSQAVQAVPPGLPMHIEASTELGIALFTRFAAKDAADPTQSADDLDRAFDVIQRGLRTTDPGVPGYSRAMGQLALLHQGRYLKSSALSDLDTAIATFTALAEDEPSIDLYHTLMNLSGRKFLVTEDDDDLNRAIDAGTTALKTMAPHDGRGLETLRGLLYRRFLSKESLQDLELALILVKRALGLELTETPKHIHLLHHWSLLQRLHFEHAASGSREDLLGALDAARRVENATPLNSPSRAERLENLGQCLMESSKWFTSDSDLDQAIVRLAQAVEATPPEQATECARRLWHHGGALRLRFGRTGKRGDIDLSIQLAKQALEIFPQPQTPQGFLEYGALQQGLSISLLDRVELTRNPDDLREAIEAAKTALAFVPEGTQARSAAQDALGCALLRKFETTKSLDDLNDAIDVTTRAMDGCLTGHSARASIMGNLATWLAARFERIRSIEDLDHSVKLLTSALDILPKDSSDRPRLHNVLAKALNWRFERTRDYEDIKGAIEAIEQALDETPPEHPSRADHFSTLAFLHRSKFKWLLDLPDSKGPDHSVVTAAIGFATQAVEATPKEHPTALSDKLDQLATMIQLRSETARLERAQIDDATQPTVDLNLDKAIETRTQALELCPRDYHNRPLTLYNHATSLCERYQLSGIRNDQDVALRCYQEGVALRNVTPYLRIHFLRGIADVLASRGEWRESSGLYREALQLLPRMSPRFLKNEDRQELLATCWDLATAAAATTIQAAETADPAAALQLLEQGRGFIAGMMLDVRGDVSDLLAAQPDLGERFQSLRDELDLLEGEQGLKLASGKVTDPAADAMLREEQARQRQTLDQKFDDLVHEIRGVPRFRGFLQPPSVEKLMTVADPDPVVVINMSSHRCDAFLITTSGLSLVPLPDLRMADVWPQTKYLKSGTVRQDLLQWLWDKICNPCLTALGFTHAYQGNDDNWPRVWWIPTSVLASFPLHAAQSLKKGEAGACVLDRVMSSYASSIRALLHGRRSLHANFEQKPQGPPDSALLVAMPTTPSPANRIKSLKFAELEVDEVDKLISDHLNLKTDKLISKHLNLKTDKLNRPLKGNTLAAMKNCRIFHFAGHGVSHRDPSQSSLLLEDWQTDNLTVGHLFTSRLDDNRHFLAYLSACSTAANMDGGLSDEGLHLVSAFQLAGFRHVIGTLWAVGDESCVFVAKVLYETLGEAGKTDRAVCLGLHQGLRALRASLNNGTRGRNVEMEEEKDEEEESTSSGHFPSADLSWVPYIHFGV